MNKISAIFIGLFVPCVAMADTHTLNIGGTTLSLSESCDSEHKLNVLYGGTVYCAPATTDTLTDTLHVLHNGTTYSICNGACGGGSGGGDYVMPETPGDPVELPSSCTWEQTNENAYLLSDGNQYFDTRVPLDTRNNIEVTLQVINGQSARIFGTVGSPRCYYDMTLNKFGNLGVRFGLTGSAYTLDSSERTGKNVIKTENSSSNGYKHFYLNDRALTSGNGKQVTVCTNTTNTMLVLNNDYISVDQTQSGGIKLYRIRLWNSGGTLLHDYQPVAAGTNICGYTVPTNAMYDFVDKRVYLPAGTGQMGYGVDQ